MGINGGTGIVGSGATLGGSGIHINRGGGGLSTIKWNG
jgi:hypothetical protein